MEFLGSRPASTLSSTTPPFIPLRPAPRPKSNSSIISQSSANSGRLPASSDQRGSGPVGQRSTPKTSSTTVQRDVPRLEMSMTPSILTSPVPARTQTQETILWALESATTKYHGLVSPPSNALPPPVFPSRRDSLGESSQST